MREKRIVFNNHPNIVLNTLLIKTDYFYTQFIVPRETFAKSPNEFIFIFQNESWGDIVHKFKQENIILNGGDLNRRHLLSLLHLRLTTFLLYLEADRI